MVSRNRILEISKQAALVLRETNAADRYRHQGYTRIDPFRVADAEDLSVMMRPLQDLLGAFIREPQAAGILVNTQRSPGLIHMTCAHELGHYFLGHQTTTDRNLDYGPDADPKEKEADWFAYQLLMPRHLIAETIRRRGWSEASLRDPAIIYQLSLRLGTSYTATVWTLVRLDVLRVSQREAQGLAKVSLQKLKHQLIGRDVEETISDVWVLDKNDKDLVLEPRPNDQIVVDLPSHASAGLLWSVQDAARAGFALHPLTVAMGGKDHSAIDDIVVGGPARQRYVLKHTREENAEARIELSFQERHPWKRIQIPNDKFATAAEFETIELGLNAKTRGRLIEEVSSS